MPSYVIDPSSYRIDRTKYYTEPEAIDKAAKSAKILGRRIGVWVVNKTNVSYPNVEPLIQFYGFVNPDGSFVQENLPTTKSQPGDDIVTAVNTNVMHEISLVAERHNGKVAVSKNLNVVVTFTNHKDLTSFNADMLMLGYRTEVLPETNDVKVFQPPTLKQSRA